MENCGGFPIDRSLDNWGTPAGGCLDFDSDTAQAEEISQIANAREAESSRALRKSHRRKATLPTPFTAAKTVCNYEQVAMSGGSLTVCFRYSRSSLRQSSLYSA